MAQDSLKPVPEQLKKLMTDRNWNILTGGWVSILTPNEYNKKITEAYTLGLNAVDAAQSNAPLIPNRHTERHALLKPLISNTQANVIVRQFAEEMVQLIEELGAAEAAEKRMREALENLHEAQAKNRKTES